MKDLHADSLRTRPFCAFVWRPRQVGSANARIANLNYNPGIMLSPEDLYVDLLKKSVLEELYTENEGRLQFLRACLDGRERFREDVYRDIRRRWNAMYEEYVRRNQFGMAYARPKEDIGFQHTMISRKRLDNIEMCLEAILTDELAGDCIECGVWRGGSVIFMRGYLAAHRVSDRVVWVADSFQGLPVLTLKEDEGYDLSARTHPMLAIDEETVRDLFERYGLLDDQVQFLPGWFKDTLPGAPIERLSLLRADGDLYQSTMDILHALYRKVVPGGFVIEASVDAGSLVHTDGWLGYAPLGSRGYIHKISFLRGNKHSPSELLPRVHRVVSMLKRWLLGTHQGAVSAEHLDYYLNEFTFRFNRRTSRSRGKLFFRLVQQAVAAEPTTYRSIIQAGKKTPTRIPQHIGGT